MNLLETQRIFLRRFTSDDAQLLFELDSDPEVMRFISKGEPTPLARIENEILPRLLAYYRESPPRGCWAAHRLPTGEFIGWFHLRPDKFRPQEMELGYRLKRNAWGEGLATEVSRALVHNAFHQWQYEKLSARALARNLASRRVMEKVGLRFEHEFWYGSEGFSGWTEEERHAVKYGLAWKDYRSE